MNPQRQQTGWGTHRARNARWGEVGAGIGLSLLFHGAVVAALVIGVFLGTGDDEEPTEQLEYENVELLALGEEPDPDQLPRLTGDEGSPPDAEEVAPDPEAPPQTEPEPAEDVEPDPEQLEREREEEEQRQEEERRRREEQRRQQLDDAFGEFEQEGRGDEAPEGSPDGVVGGTATDGDAEDAYLARLAQAIGNNWSLPTAISDQEAQELAGQVRVRVELSDDGHIDEFELIEESGRSLFDRSLKSSLRDFEPGEATLPLPDDDQLRDDVLRRGLILTNWEHVVR